MKRSYPLWILVYLGIAALAWVLAGGLSMYLDLPSLAVILLLPLPLLVATFPLREIRNAFFCVFHHAVDGSELRNALVVFSTMERLLLLAGLFGVISGLIGIFSHISSAEMIGRGIALALLTPLYAMVLMMAFTVPLRAAVRRRIAREAPDELV
ncbi:MAG TPA: MotA/TolQ/ExbB proton channel family protein [Spirochaetia bacterium]|nr:MotA/TolQ/ExbB proton channel family protein [Spirochaetia bacterium]